MFVLYQKVEYGKRIRYAAQPGIKTKSFNSDKICTTDLSEALRFGTAVAAVDWLKGQEHPVFTFADPGWSIKAV